MKENELAALNGFLLWGRAFIKLFTKQSSISNLSRVLRERADLAIRLINLPLWRPKLLYIMSESFSLLCVSLRVIPFLLSGFILITLFSRVLQLGQTSQVEGLLPRGATLGRRRASLVARPNLAVFFATVTRRAYVISLVILAGPLVFAFLVSVLNSRLTQLV